GADMRCNCHDSGHLGAAGREAGDEVRQIAGKASAVVVLREVAHAIEVGMHDKQSRCTPCRFMRGEKTAIVVNGRARPQTADEAEASRFLAARLRAFSAQDALMR